MRVPNAAFWSGRSVLVTGHKGFKGNWLAQWLSSMGADVHGFDKSGAESNPVGDWEAIPVASSIVGDITDYKSLVDYSATIRPDVVFHLAAQPLVRASYLDPAATFLDNVQGTINVLEMVRAGSASVCICVTSDKVYLNNDQGRPFVEDDPLGGWDPYSASKAATDIAVQSYAKSFFGPTAGRHRHPARVASVRAGNVIGGGDWAADRLVPDAIRAFQLGQSVEIRSPTATRPWQHVLDPLCGYILLAEAAGESEALEHTAWNFGPLPEDALTVAQVMQLVVDAWGSNAAFHVLQDKNGGHEAARLAVDSSRATAALQWQPRWQAPMAIKKTVEWFKAHQAGANGTDLMRADIDSYLG